MKAPTASVTLSEVSFSYCPTDTGQSELSVLNRLSFTAASGELLAVVGPSGCGKTTVLNLVAGLLTPDSGRIDISNSLAMHPRRTAYVFQSARLVPWLTVEENALLGAELGGAVTDELRRECHRRLTTYSLGGFERSFPHMLSGGMQQRVSLLRALLSGAKLLLLDEPFVNSDFVLRRQLQLELSDAVTTNNLVGIIVTHELTQAARLADEVVVLSERPAEIVDRFRISIDRAARLRGEPSALRDLSEYMTRLEQAVSKSRKSYS